MADREKVLLARLQRIAKWAGLTVEQLAYVPEPKLRRVDGLGNAALAVLWGMYPEGKRRSELAYALDRFSDADLRDMLEIRENVAAGLDQTPMIVTALDYAVEKERRRIADLARQFREADQAKFDAAQAQADAERRDLNRRPSPLWS